MEASLSMIQTLIQENNLLDLPVIIIQLEEPIDENLTGLIANKIMSNYMQPVLILNHHIETNEETGEIIADKWMGSGRNATYSTLENFRDFIEKSNVVEFAQGHAGAFGVSILDKNISLLKQYIKKELKDFNFTNSYRVDFIWNACEIDKYQDDIIKIGELSDIWG